MESSCHFCSITLEPRNLTKNSNSAASGLALYLYSRGTDNAENIVLLLRGADHTENKSHVIVTQLVHWRADCCLATSYKYSSHCCVRVSRDVYQAVAWQCVGISMIV
jgi:hypothetical protein